MPKLTFDIHDPPSSTLESACVCIAPHGFIDSSNCQYFERALQNSERKETRFAVLDLSDVHYINSTGISLIIRSFGVFKERNGLLALVAVPRSVGLSMHLLGVTSLIPFHKDAASALEQFKGIEEGSIALEAVVKVPDRAAVERAPKAAATERVYVPVKPQRSPLADARVMVLLPRPMRLARVLRKRYAGLNGNFLLYHDAEEALNAIDRLTPDIVVLDHRMDESGRFVRKLKMHPERSLISVIKLYGSAAQIDQTADFKIWENDYLVDPFDVLELFSLSEAELLRVPKDRKVFHQQVRFGFRCTHENVERAMQLGDLIIRNSLGQEEDRTALFAAVKEGVDNAALHGDQWNGEKRIDINFLVDQAKVTVMIEDEGEGFDYEYYLARLDDEETFERAKRRILEEKQRGGLGILLMHRCTDRIDYAGSGNILRLEKNRT